MRSKSKINKIIIHCSPFTEIITKQLQVNEPVAQGLRPLHYAVWQKNIDAVRLLLVRGADINAIDAVGYSALHLCSEHGLV